MNLVLLVEDGPDAGLRFAVGPGKVSVVGSSAQADVRLEDVGLESRHTALMVDPEGLMVIDLGGAAGTFLNGARLAARQPTSARPGDRLKIGAVRVRIQTGGVGGASLPIPMIAQPASPIPAGEYEVVKELGRGGMGRVLAARRRADGRPVAIKVLNESIVPGSPEHKRFLQEGRIGQKIQSPYVVEVLDAQVADGHPFIVMEFVTGGSCEDRLERGGPLPVAEVARIGGQVAHALAAAATVSVVHRDIKPANIMLDAQGSAKLTDFGVAKDLESTMASLTAAGMGLGTLTYMAPEQVSEAKDADASSDLYALGGTLYHLLTGQPPFDIQDLRDLIMAEDEEPRPVADLRPDCPPELAALVHAMLAKHPWERPASAAVVAAQLEAIGQRLC